MNKRQFYDKIIQILNLIFHIFSVKKKWVLFFSYAGDVLVSNLACMYDIIPESEYKKIVLFGSSLTAKKNFFEIIKTVYYMSVSKYIFLDDYFRIVNLLHPRKIQQIIQLWHGSGAFKKIGYSRIDRNKKSETKDYSNHRNYTKTIVSSESVREFIAEGFGMDIQDVSATGCPKTDVFFNKTCKKEIKEKIYRKYPFLKRKKIILFAPTYRGTKRNKAYFNYASLDLEALYNKFKENYIFIFKWHPAIYKKIIEEKKHFDFSEYSNFYFDLSDYKDINELLFVTDVLVTDYSSVIFEYALLKKPIVYFVPDLAEYIDNRGLYFPFDEYVYGEIAETSQELLSAIEKEDLMLNKREKFLKTFMNKCDGNSTKKVYDLVFCKNARKS